MQQRQLPNAIATLVLGILSIITGCYVIGLILGIIALVISKEPMKLYREDPTQWSDYAMLNAGRITAIIGTALGAMAIIFWIIYIAFIAVVIESGYSNDFPFDI